MEKQPSSPFFDNGEEFVGGVEEEEEDDSVGDQHMESSSASSSAAPRGEVVAEPLPMDVICGRGSRITHPGNQRFRKLVAEQKDTYQRAKRREDKTKITLDIVQKLMRCEEPSRYVKLPYDGMCQSA